MTYTVYVIYVEKLKVKDNNVDGNRKEKSFEFWNYQICAWVH